MASGGDGTEDTRGKEIKQISAAAKGGDTVTVSHRQRRDLNALEK